MFDRHSTDLAGAAYYARTESLADDDRPTRAELAADDERVRASDDPYRGICGGCKRPVCANGPEGSCLWTGGPWHPSCRRADQVTTRRAA